MAPFFPTHFELPPPILAPKSVSLVIWTPEKGGETAVGTHELSWTTLRRSEVRILLLT